MNVIAIANQKGGTAKTTTAAVLGLLLSRRGRRVHLIDMDPQASLTQAFGREDETDRLYVSLKDRAGLPVDALAPNLTLTPSTIELGRLETELLPEPGREHYLRASLERTSLPANSLVLLDCPPSLGILAVNGLAIAGGLIVPVQPGGFELYALARLEVTVEAVHDRLNPDLAVLGIVLTNCHRRRKITGRVEAELGRIQVVLGTVRADARLLYATTNGTLRNLRRSNALDDYGVVVDQLDRMLP